MNARAATGDWPGDYLELANKWASVAIIRGDTDWLVTGDIAHPLECSRAFPTMRAALAYAFESLALFERGRCAR